MINKVISLAKDSSATLTTYVLQQDKYDYRGVKRPAVIVCPGGGYQFVSENEGEPVALAYAREGYCAFVLDYSVRIENPFPKGLSELALAVKFVREHAGEWNIDSDDISVAGFSAGGHLAASLGVFYDKKFLQELVHAKEDEIKPNALILGYPALSLIKWNTAPMAPEIAKMMDDGLMPDLRGEDILQIIAGKLDVTDEDADYFNLMNQVTKKTPPSFLWGSNQDTVIHPSDLWGFAAKLREYDVPYELHIFGRGPHGQSTADQVIAAKEQLSTHHLRHWLPLSLMWLEEKRNEQV
jgi:acetyl esterase/lipase